MNKRREGVGELENNRCQTTNKILDVRSASYVQAVCTLQLFPVLSFLTEGTFVCACAGRNKRVVHESRDCRGNPNIGGNFKVQFVNKLFQTYDICYMPNF